MNQELKQLYDADVYEHAHVPPLAEQLRKAEEATRNLHPFRLAMMRQNGEKLPFKDGKEKNQAIKAIIRCQQTTVALPSREERFKVLLSSL